MPAQDTTPLLSDYHGLPLHTGITQVREPPSIAREASHSVWPWLSQRALVFLRASIVVYLTALTPVLFSNKVAESAAKNLTLWSILFDFSTISHVLQWLWHLMSFLWSFKYHSEGFETDEDHRRFLSRALSILSPCTRSSTSNFYYTVLYTAAYIATVLNAIIYWAVLVPHEHGGSSQDEAFGNCWFKILSTIHLYGVSPIIASGEVVFLNSIEHQRPLSSQVLPVVFLLSNYLGWAAIGNTMTGHYPFFWMDPQEMGGTKLVAAYGSGFVAMGPAAFAAMRGLTLLRDNLAKYFSRRGQYIQIHDSEDDEEHVSIRPGNVSARDHV
ncbi:hypothetical protein VTI74DRAFT_2976 [Chaetomium olivicolor]